MKRFVALGLAAAFTAACSENPTGSAPEAPTPQAPVFSVNVGDPIPGQYIVVFKDGGPSASATASALASKHRDAPRMMYNDAVKGMALSLSDKEVDVMRADPRVAYVEQDQIATVTATQSNPSWGLDRIDQHTLPLNQTYAYANDGTGVNVYMVDTGIRYDHTEFGGRAVKGFDAVTANGDAGDCHGHGTQTAGIVGGSTYGVAKNVKLYSVRVFDCQAAGSTSTIINGVNWVTSHRVLPAVMDINAGVNTSSALNTAVQNAINAGVTVVVTSGNNTANACSHSPASAPNALTVSAVDSTDKWASFSNYGSCIDISAPGVNIKTSANGLTNSATSQLSGTSAAAPHVAGAVALYLKANPSATPAQVRSAFVGQATLNKITGIPSGTANVLLYTGFIGSALPPNQLPTAAISSPTNNASFAAGASVSFAGSASDPEDGVLSGASLTWTSSINGAIGTGTSFTKTNLSIGSHTITLTATDSKNGTTTVTRTITITGSVNQPPTASVTTPGANASYGQGTNISFTGTGSDPEDGVLVGASLTWTSDINGVIGTGTSFSSSALSVGTHIITLTAKDSKNATAVSTRRIYVTAVTNQLPTASISAPTNNASFVAGTSVAFAGSGSDPEDGVLSGASLTWTSSINGAIGTGTSFAMSALSVGTHTITLTAKDSKNAINTATRTITITAPVNQLPTASIATPSNNASFVQGVSISLSGSGSDPEDGALSGASLTWTSSINGVLGTGASLSVSALSVGTHTITLTAKDSQNATSTSTITVIVTAAAGNQPPVANFTWSCTGLLARQCAFDASSSSDDTGIVLYAWDWGDGRSEARGIPTVKNMWSLSILYNVTLTVTDSNGVKTSITKNVLIP